MTTLLSLQGCENEEGTAIHSRDTVSFEIDAGGARATETTFETGDAIGVYAAVRMSSAPATLKTSGNYADNKRFVWNGSQFVADGDANEIAAGYETDYYAYYPYREDMGNPLDYDFSIQGDQREGITLSDFMYAANRSGTTDKVITLAFSHRLSRLQVTYTPEAGEALSGVTIQRAKATANINREPAPPIPLEPPRIYGCIMTAAHSLRSFRRRTGMPTVHSLPFYLPTAQKGLHPYGKERIPCGAYYRNSVHGQRAAVYLYRQSGNHRQRLFRRHL